MKGAIVKLWGMGLFCLFVLKLFFSLVCNLSKLFLFRFFFFLLVLFVFPLFFFFDGLFFVRCSFFCWFWKWFGSPLFCIFFSRCYNAVFFPPFMSVLQLNHLQFWIKYFESISIRSMIISMFQVVSLNHFRLDSARR